MTSIDAKLARISNELKVHIAEDSGVPKNIRRGAVDAINLLISCGKPLDLRISSAINILADLSDDTNLPMESWSIIMHILSDLEIALKEVTNSQG
ncbi:MAG: UPF0147 family protein [archaeon]|nr:UPF0147 family protein [archaeon]